MISQTEVWRRALCHFTSFPQRSDRPLPAYEASFHRVFLNNIRDRKGDWWWWCGFNRGWKTSRLLAKSEWTEDVIIAQLCIIATVLRSGYFCKCSPYVWLWYPACKVIHYVCFFFLFLSELTLSNKSKPELLRNGNFILLSSFQTVKAKDCQNSLVLT